MAARTIRLAVIGGDGVGPEVVAEAIKVLGAAAAGLSFETTDYDLGAGRWLRTGEALPGSVLGEISGHDAILLGPLGDPRVPAGVLDRGLLYPLQAALDQCVTVRPVRLFAGAVSPIADLRPDSVDMLVIRETIPGAFGDARVLRYALQRTAERPRRSLAVVSAAGPPPDTAGARRRAAEELLAERPGITAEFLPIDMASMYLVTQPERFDVIVTDSIVGDTMSLLGAAITGGIRLAAGASINPGDAAPGMFGPVHGSAPRIAGQQKADPTAAILAAAMLCGHLGLAAEATRIEQAVIDDLLARQGAWQTRATPEVGDDIAELVAG